jgi:hypothetical protein
VTAHTEKINQLLILVAISLIAYVLYLNSPKYDYFSLYYILLVLLTLIFPNRVELLYAVGLASLIVMCFEVTPFVFNFHSHDYPVYSSAVRSPLPRDLPLSWLLMKIFSILLGNPLGLMVLSFTCVLALDIAFQCGMLRGGDARLFALTPMILLGNQGLRHLMDGVLRNILAFTIITYTLLIKQTEKRSSLTVLVLGLTHIPSMIYYTLYKLLKKEHVIPTTFTAIATFGVMAALASVFGGPLWKSADKLLQLFLFKLRHPIPRFYNPFQHQDWRKYLLAVSSIIPIGLKKHLEQKQGETLVWLFFIALPLLPIHNWETMKRILYVTWLPLLMILRGTGHSLANQTYAALFTIYSVRSWNP